MTNTTARRMLALALATVAAMAIAVSATNFAGAVIGQPTESETATATPTSTESPTATPSPTETATEPGLPLPSQPEEGVESGRLAGITRIETAVEISKYNFPEGAPTAYLAQSEDYPDALAGGTVTDGPILLVPPCGDLPQVVADELARLMPDTVIALGGQQAICDSMLDQAVAAAEDQGTEEPTEEPTPTETATASPTPTATATASEEPCNLGPLCPPSETASPTPTPTATATN